ncbi:hypothetical protein WMY93_001731 [Mugilogobius chulae]|uniref:CDP-diacylglycerol--inositol 3-phosphatidyltransferase n=1 Tax=Mugilogobius chulae TaxID=88201 RepID=A0AAW0Q030_9GOBI
MMLSTEATSSKPHPTLRFRPDSCPSSRNSLRFWKDPLQTGLCPGPRFWKDPLQTGLCPGLFWRTSRPVVSGPLLEGPTPDRFLVVQVLASGRTHSRPGLCPGPRFWKDPLQTGLCPGPRFWKDPLQTGLCPGPRFWKDPLQTGLCPGPRFWKDPLQTGLCPGPRFWKDPLQTGLCPGPRFWKDPLQTGLCPGPRFWKDPLQTGSCPGSRSGSSSHFQEIVKDDPWSRPLRLRTTAVHQEHLKKKRGRTMTAVTGCQGQTGRRVVLLRDARYVLTHTGSVKPIAFPPEAAEKPVFSPLFSRFRLELVDFRTRSVAMSEENIFLFVPNLIGYARVVLALLSFLLMPCCPWPAVFCYLLSALLDAFDGHAARALNQSTKFGAMMDMLTDRCATMCLLVNLSLLYPGYTFFFQVSPDYTFLFQVSMCLDISSHWLHLHSSTIKGSSSHKSIDLSGNPILRVYYTSKPVLFVMCAGNELFFCLLYVMYHIQEPAGWLYVLLFVCALISLAKSAISVVHLITASQNMAALDTAERQKDKKM